MPPGLGGVHSGVPKGDLWQDPMVPVSWQRTCFLLLGGFIGRRRTKYLEDLEGTVVGKNVDFAWIPLEAAVLLTAHLLIFVLLAIGL